MLNPYSKCSKYSIFLFPISRFHVIGNNKNSLVFNKPISPKMPSNKKTAPVSEQEARPNLQTSFLTLQAHFSVLYAIAQSHKFR